MRTEDDLRFLRGVYYDMVQDAKENSEVCRRWKFAVNMLDYVLEDTNTFHPNEFEPGIIVGADQ